MEDRPAADSVASVAPSNTPPPVQSEGVLLRAMATPGRFYGYLTGQGSAAAADPSAITAAQNVTTQRVSGLPRGPLFGPLGDTGQPANDEGLNRAVDRSVDRAARDATAQVGTQRGREDAPDVGHHRPPISLINLHTAALITSVDPQGHDYTSASDGPADSRTARSCRKARSPMSS